jgi:hypothetical protein
MDPLLTIFERRASLWKELINHRLHNLMKEMVTVETPLKLQQVYYVKPGRTPTINEHELPRLNSPAECTGTNVERSEDCGGSSPNCALSLA